MNLRQKEKEKKDGIYDLSVKIKLAFYVFLVKLVILIIKLDSELSTTTKG